MRFRTLEIRWHDSKPISSCDFQPVPFKKARPAAGQEKNYPTQAYRLATGGEDNHVRIWMVHPNIMPTSLVESASTSTPASVRPARIEYLATLSRHSAAVNVVRFSPNGELIASAGDDGMIIIWAPSTSPQASTYGSDLGPEDLQHEKEYWKPRTTFRCTTMQVYDLAWSPSGEYIFAGSTDNAARVFTASDGKCVHEIAEHSHYVQGVAWDPLNEYIATQSSDRSMHIYRISTKQGAFEAHAIGKNTRLPHHHSRTPSHSRPRMSQRDSAISDVESEHELSSSASASGSQAQTKEASTPLTPATSVASTPSASMFPPPPIDKPSSRRSSFSGSNAPSSPAAFNRYGRSPSPMPALPAIRTLPSAAAAWASVKLYGDESFTNFFRRLTFSPDGGLLLTPAGQFEDPSVTPGASTSTGTKATDDPTPARGRRARPSISTGDAPAPTPASSVYIYSRANFARPPIAQLPGHRKASVAVRFSPILYELREAGAGAGAGAADAAPERTPRAVLERGGREGALAVDVVGPLPAGDAGPLLAPPRAPAHAAIAAPTPQLADAAGAVRPAGSRPLTPAASQPATPAPAPPTPAHARAGAGAAGVFALPYRMLFAVVTMDTVALYDTQQAGPVALLTQLHYDEFTDVSWSPDGQCLLVAARDGYCTVITLDEILPAYHTQQHALQLQSIAHQHSVPLTYAHTPMPATPAATPAPLPAPSNVPAKRSEPLTPTTSVDGEGGAAGTETKEPPKKKRRVALTHVGDLGS